MNTMNTHCKDQCERLQGEHYTLEKTEIRELLGTRRSSSRNRCDQEKQGTEGTVRAQVPSQGEIRGPRSSR